MNRLLSVVSVLLVLTLSQSLAGAYPQAYRWVKVLGTIGTANGQFSRPNRLCVDGSKLYVVDAGNGRIQVLSLTGAFLGKFGDYATLGDPSGIVLDPDHNVYVTDTTNHRISKFDATWAYKASAGTQGTTGNQFNIPLGIAWDPLHGRLAVADRFNNRLAFWSAALSPIGVQKPTGARALSEPGGIAYAPAGNYFVVDTGHGRVERYTAAGVYQGTFTSGLSYPYTAVVGPDGNLIIADTLHSRIVKTTPSGEVLAAFGTLGSGVNQFAYPYAVAVDPSGFVYVSDNNNHRVVRLRPDRKPTAPTSVTISPVAPTGANDLTAKATGSTDADGDVVEYRYRWYSRTSGSAPWVPSGRASRVLPASATTVGERWKVQARSFDGDLYSAWVDSAEVLIKAPAAPGLSATAAATAVGAAITVSLPAAARVQVTILNLAGRTVAALPVQALPAGVSTLLWNGRATTGTLAPHGQYLLRATASGADGSFASATSGFTR